MNQEPFDAFCFALMRGVTGNPQGDTLLVDYEQLRAIHAYLLATGADPAAVLAGRATAERTDLAPLNALVTGYEKSVARANAFLEIQRKNPLVDKSDTVAVRAEKQITEAFLSELKAALAKCVEAPPRDDCAELRKRIGEVAERWASEANQNEKDQYTAFSAGATSRLLDCASELTAALDEMGGGQ